MTGDYIDKWLVVHKLVQLENEYHFHKEEWDAEVLYQRLCKLEIEIGKIQPAEAEPVVHAHWEVRYVRSHARSEYFCTACGRPQLRESKRCPECGAHMDERYLNE